MLIMLRIQPAVDIICDEQRPGKWAETVAYFGSLLLLGNNLTRTSILRWRFYGKKPAGVGPPNSIVHQAHLRRRAKRSKRSRDLLRCGEFVINEARGL